MLPGISQTNHRRFNRQEIAEIVPDSWPRSPSATRRRRSDRWVCLQQNGERVRLMSSIEAQKSNLKSSRNDSVSSYLLAICFVPKLVKYLNNISEIVQALAAPVPQLASLAALLDGPDLFVNPVKCASAASSCSTVTPKIPLKIRLSLSPVPSASSVVPQVGRCRSDQDLAHNHARDVNKRHN